MTAPTTSLRGRRRAPSKGDRREQAILATARRLLQERPLAELTVDELSRGAGISRSSFYFYFDGKSAVLAALLDELAAELAPENTPWLDGSGPDVEALRTAITHSVDLWRTSGGLLRQAFAPGSATEPLAAWRREVVARGVRRLAARIDRDRRLGWDLGDLPAESLAEMTAAMRDGTLAARSGVVPDEQLVDELVAATLRLLYGSRPNRVADGDDGHR